MVDTGDGRTADRGPGSGGGIVDLRRAQDVIAVASANDEHGAVGQERGRGEARPSTRSPVAVQAPVPGSYSSAVAT